LLVKRYICFHLKLIIIIRLLNGRIPCVLFHVNKNVRNQNKDNFSPWYYFVICARFAWFLYRDYILYYYIGFFLSNNENMLRHRYYNIRTRSVFRKWKYNRCGLERCCIRLLRYSTRTHNIFTCSNKKEKKIIMYKKIKYTFDVHFKGICFWITTKK